MSKPIVKIVDVITGKEIEREMTQDEFVIYEKNHQEETRRLEKIQAKAAARQAMLDRLGLTEEEARLLLG